MLIDTEEKAKIAVQCCIGTALIYLGYIGLGVATFAIMLPWSVVARAGYWLVEPLLRRRTGKREA